MKCIYLVSPVTYLQMTTQNACIFEMNTVVQVKFWNLYTSVAHALSYKVHDVDMSS